MESASRQIMLSLLLKDLQIIRNSLETSKFTVREKKIAIASVSITQHRIKKFFRNEVN